MKIKNLFFAFIITLFIGNTVFAQSAGIPLSEYNLLKEFYGNTYGSGWTNNTNWLDTTNHSVADWFGITVENNHVTKIELSNNNLQEAIFGTRFLLPELKILDLSGNIIDDANFGNLDSLSNLEVLKIENNKFIFKHIRDVSFLPNYNNFSGNFTYSPQAKIDVAEEISVNKGDLIEMYVSSRYLSANDQLQWYKDDVALVGKTSASFDKTNAVAEDAGTYYLKITNPDVSGLTLQSFDKVVTVTDLVAGVPRSEFNALESFYYSTNGENWNNNTNWLDTANYLVDNWYGVTVEDGHVTKIELKENNLSGSIPENIEQLTNLINLDLVINNIISIPPQIGNLPFLQNLELRHNKISGSIPKEIGNLTNLNNLCLADNAFSGVIPKELGNLSKLGILSLYANNLSGEIPAEFGTLSNVGILFLQNNQLSGKIPSEFGNLTNLQALHLNNNRIRGPIPAELNKLDKLYYFNISNNCIGKKIDGEIREARQIPNEIGTLSLLKYFDISSNYFQFNDIEAVFNWSIYSSFTLFKYNNQFSVSDQKEITIESGEYFNISMASYYESNSDLYQWYKNSQPIEGATDSIIEFQNAKVSDEGEYYCIVTNTVVPDISILYYRTTVNFNGVHGAGIPLKEYLALEKLYNENNGDQWGWNENWLDTITCTVNEWQNVWVEDGHVHSLMMDSVHTISVLPVELANLEYLNRLSFLNINLNMELPSWIGEFKYLETLYLSQNNLIGAIPATIGQLTNLKLLYLGNNQLSGNIPSEIGNCINLQSIYLDNNNLTGSIPQSLGDLVLLTSLNLDHNLLSGTIPASLGNLIKLWRLDLSNNQLIGPVPAELKNLTKVYRIELDNNLIGGSNSGEKSATLKNSTVENNRQIPDELSGLIYMDTFRLGNNSLQFNDIEAIFSWDNFSDFKDFIYHPQGLLGTEKNIGKTENESVTLSIENQYPGNSDNYKWYKNGTLLANSNSKTLIISNLKTSHSGKYHCVVTNSVATELSLTSKEITLTVNKADNNYNVPVSEYNALKALEVSR